MALSIEQLNSTGLLHQGIGRVVEIRETSYDPSNFHVLNELVKDTSILLDQVRDSLDCWSGGIVRNGNKPTEFFLVKPIIVGPAASLLPANLTEQIEVNVLELLNPETSFHPDALVNRFPLSNLFTYAIKIMRMVEGWNIAKVDKEATFGIIMPDLIRIDAGSHRKLDILLGQLRVRADLWVPPTSGTLLTSTLNNGSHFSKVLMRPPNSININCGSVRTSRFEY